MEMTVYPEKTISCRVSVNAAEENTTKTNAQEGATRRIRMRYHAMVLIGQGVSHATRKCRMAFPGYLHARLSPATD